MAVPGSIRSKCPLILSSYPLILSTASVQRIRREPIRFRSGNYGERERETPTNATNVNGSSNDGYVSLQRGKLTSTMYQRSYKMLHRNSSSRLNSNTTIEHRAYPWTNHHRSSKNTLRCYSSRFYSSRRTKDSESCDDQENSRQDTNTRSNEYCNDHQHPSSNRTNHHDHHHHDHHHQDHHHHDCEPNPGDINHQDCKPAPGTCTPSPVDQPCPEQPEAVPPVCSVPEPPCPEPVEPCPRDESRNLALWRALSLFLALPLVLVSLVMVCSELEEEANEPGPPYLDVPYMYRRTKRFPWGDGNHSLLHNPRKNPVRPDGYEVVEEATKEEATMEVVEEEEGPTDEPGPTEE